jgi:hypothetical protein
MRPFSRPIGETTILLRALIPPDGRRQRADEYAEAVSLRGAMQPLGDTGRRQDRFDEQSRLGSIEGWRLFVRAEALAEAGLSYPWCKRGDVVERADMPGLRHSCRGGPVSQALGDDGSPVLWSVDLDGVS